MENNNSKEKERKKERNEEKAEQNKTTTATKQKRRREVEKEKNFSLPLRVYFVGVSRQLYPTILPQHLLPTSFKLTHQSKMKSRIFEVLLLSMYSALTGHYFLNSLFLWVLFRAFVSQRNALSAFHSKSMALQLFNSALCSCLRKLWSLFASQGLRNVSICM